MPYFRAFQLFWLRLPYLWIQSLLWWISIISYFDIQINPCWNRTLTYHFSTSISLNHDWTLGGPRYIHLTKGTNAVFSGFSAFLAPAAMFMNPITCVMNCLCYYILILVFLQTLKSCYVSLNGLHLVAPLGELQPIVTLCQSEVR